MPSSSGELETFLALILDDQAPSLAKAHDELYPVRVEEGIIDFPRLSKETLPRTRAANPLVLRHTKALELRMGAR